MYGICLKIFIRNQFNVCFKELHNDQEYYWPTTYRAGAAVVSTITSNNKLLTLQVHYYDQHQFFPNNNQSKENVVRINIVII